MNMLEHLKKLQNPKQIQVNIEFPDMDNDWTVVEDLNQECIRLDNIEAGHPNLRTVWGYIVKQSLAFDQLYFEKYFSRTPYELWPIEDPDVRPSIKLLVDTLQQKPTLKALEIPGILKHMSLTQVGEVLTYMLSQIKSPPVYVLINTQLNDYLEVYPHSCDVHHIQKNLNHYPVIQVWMLTLKVKEIINHKDWCDAFDNTTPHLSKNDIRQWVMFLCQNKTLGKEIKDETGFRWSEHLERNATTGSDAVKEFSLFSSLYPNPSYDNCLKHWPTMDPRKAIESYPISNLYIPEPT